MAIVFETQYPVPSKIGEEIKMFKKGSCNTADIASLPTDVAGGSRVLIVDPADGAAPGRIFNEDTGTWDDFFFNTGGDSLPPVTPADDGKVLAVKNGAWAAQETKFVVTLTPTSTDFSGTMDKTPQEITAAYNAGMKIVFDIPSLYARTDADQYLQVGSNIKAAAKVFYDIDGEPVLITIATSGDDDDQTYGTDIYPLTYQSAQGVSF